MLFRVAFGGSILFGFMCSDWYSVNCAIDLLVGRRGFREREWRICALTWRSDGYLMKRLIGILFVKARLFGRYWQQAVACVNCLAYKRTGVRRFLIREGSGGMGFVQYTYCLLYTSPSPRDRG